MFLTFIDMVLIISWIYREGNGWGQGEKNPLPQIGHTFKRRKYYWK
jgi:hypothetical protein